jgi:hypothetical protein
MHRIWRCSLDFTIRGPPGGADTQHLAPGHPIFRACLSLSRAGQWPSACHSLEVRPSTPNLTSTGTLDQVADALAEAETALGLSYMPVVNSRAKSQTPGQSSIHLRPHLRSPRRSPSSPIRLAIHTLVLGVLWFTHVGQAGEAALRLSHLRAKVPRAPSSWVSSRFVPSCVDCLGS